MTLKVYSWQGWRQECPPANNGNRQTREICAASSGAAVARTMGVKYPRQLFNFSECSHEESCTVALAAPGTVFWHPIDEHERNRNWRPANG